MCAGCRQPSESSRGVCREVEAVSTCALCQQQEVHGLPEREFGTICSLNDQAAGPFRGRCFPRNPCPPTLGLLPAWAGGGSGSGECVYAAEIPAPDPDSQLRTSEKTLDVETESPDRLPQAPRARAEERVGSWRLRPVGAADLLEGHMEDLNPLARRLGRHKAPTQS